MSLKYENEINDFKVRQSKEITLRSGPENDKLIVTYKQSNGDTYTKPFTRSQQLEILAAEPVYQNNYFGMVFFQAIMWSDGCFPLAVELFGSWLGSLTKNNASDVVIQAELYHENSVCDQSITTNHVKNFSVYWFSDGLPPYETSFCFYALEANTIFDIACRQMYTISLSGQNYESSFNAGYFPAGALPVYSNNVCIADNQPTKKYDNITRVQSPTVDRFNTQKNKFVYNICCYYEY